MPQFDIICTFEKSEQAMFVCNVPNMDATCTDETFVMCVLSQLTTDECEQLLKLSVCQLTQNDDEEQLPCLAARNGKYYFNKDVNKNDDTVMLDKLRASIVLTRSVSVGFQ